VYVCLSVCVANAIVGVPIIWYTHTHTHTHTQKAAEKMMMMMMMITIQGIFRDIKYELPSAGIAHFFVDDEMIRDPDAGLRVLFGRNAKSGTREEGGGRGRARTDESGRG